DLQLGNDLTAGRSFYRDVNLLRSHFWKRVLQIWLKFLPNPDNRLTQPSHRVDELADGPNQSPPRSRRPLVKKVVEHVDHDQHRLIHPYGLPGRLMLTLRDIAYSNPNSFHRFVTCSLVFSSMRISSGQGRV